MNSFLLLLDNSMRVGLPEGQDKLHDIWHQWKRLLPGKPDQIRERDFGAGLTGPENVHVQG